MAGVTIRAFLLKMNRLTIKEFVFVLLLLMSVTMVAETQEKRFSVMGMGDSITEGGDEFNSYLYPLWQLFQRKGYEVDFIGPRERKTPAGVLRHCGFSGKPVEFIEARVDSIYRLYPADIVLLHAGHNHFADQQPVDGMIKAYQHIISTIHTINPEALVFIAQVTPSGKLPKYSYIPELNRRIAEMVTGGADHHLFLVDMATGHDWRTMTIHDRVHPNQKGAKRMAKRWFKAIKKGQKSMKERKK